MREEGETTSSQEPMMVDEAQVRVATVGGSARRNTFLHPRRLRLEHSAAFMIQPSSTSSWMVLGSFPLSSSSETSLTCLLRRR